MSLIQKKQNFFLQNKHFDQIFIKLEEYSALIAENCQQGLDNEDTSELRGLISTLKIINKRL